MTIEGAAYLVDGALRTPLKEKMVLSAGDTIEVDANSSVDLAYDRDWKNITRVNENSRVRINGIFPTKLVMIRGDIYAKLRSLPKGSSFEIKTPTAVAAVRGSEYRTMYRGGMTRVYNFAHSKVEVFGLGMKIMALTGLEIFLDS